MATAAGSSQSATPTMPAPAATSANNTKRGKGKKSTDPVNTSKQIEDTIAQLEKSRAGEKDAEQEIERDVRKADRELKSQLSKLQGSQTQVDLLQKKYSDLLSDMKRLEREHVKSKKRADQLQKEKDSSRSELSKMTTVKEKLEKLCRELQKENKKVKDENRRLGETESRLREELHERLEGMIGDVQDFIDQTEHPESTPTNLESDELFRQKFKSFIDQYELRELQFQSVLRSKDFEIQYQLARFENQRKASEQEASRSRQLTSQVSTFSQTETELRSQLNIYVEKFKQVEDTLNNSNDLFLTFRREMEEMSKKTKRLEKENHALTRKQELTNHNILQMAEERTKINRELDLLRKKNENLEKLCRGMQAQGRGTAAPAARDNTANGTHDEELLKGTGVRGGAIDYAHGHAQGHVGTHGHARNGVLKHVDAISSSENTESEYEYDDDEFNEDLERPFEDDDDDGDDEGADNDGDGSDDGSTDAFVDATARHHTDPPRPAEHTQHAQPDNFGGLPGQKPLPAFGMQSNTPRAEQRARPSGQGGHEHGAAHGPGHGPSHGKQANGVKR